LSEERKKIIFELSVSDKTQASLDRAHDTVEKTERKTQSALQTARSVELNINRALTLFETGMRIAEKAGLQIDKQLKENINDIQLTLRFMSTATTMAMKLGKSLRGLSGMAKGILGGLGAAGLAVGGAYALNEWMEGEKAKQYQAWAAWTPAAARETIISGLEGGSRLSRMFAERMRAYAQETA
jgi:hypothetical protein